MEEVPVLGIGQQQDREARGRSRSLQTRGQCFTQVMEGCKVAAGRGA